MTSDRSSSPSDELADLVEVAVAGSRPEADVMRSVLADAGIDSMVSSDDCGGFRPELTPRTGVRLFVRRSDEATARALLSPGA